MMGGNLGAAVQMLKVINQQGGGSQSWEQYWATRSLFFLDGTILDVEGTKYFVDKSTNGRNFLITGYDLNVSEGFPYKSAATISAPVGDVALIAADINNFLYDSGGTPNQIPVISLFSNIDYQNRIFCKHEAQIVDENDVETYEPRVSKIFMSAAALSASDLTKVLTDFGAESYSTNDKCFAPHGDDTTGDGTPALPYLTLAKAMTEATTNAIAMTGTYDMGAAHPTLTKGFKGVGFTKFTNYATNGFIQNGKTITGIWFSGTAEYPIYSTGGTVLKCKSTGNTRYFIFVNGGVNLTVKNCIIGCSGTTYRTLELKCTTPVIDSNIFVDTNASSINLYNTGINATIKHNLFKGTVTQSVYFYADYNTLTCVDNKIINQGFIINTGSLNGDINAKYNQLSSTGNNSFIKLSGGTGTVTATDNKVTTVSTNVISVTKKNLVAQNNIFNNNSSSYSVIQVFSSGGTTVNITSNRIVNAGTGTPIIIGYEGIGEVNTISGTISKNYIQGAINNHGIFVYDNANFKVSHNYIKNCLLGIVLKGTNRDYSDCDVWANIIENGRIVLKGIDNANIIGNTIIHTVLIDTPCIFSTPNLLDYSNGNILKNNIFFNAIAVSGYGYSSVYADNANESFVSDYNLFYPSGLPIGNDGSSEYATMALWQAAGYDAHGLNVDPSLDANYKPQAGSPVIGAAEVLTADYDDGLDASTNWGDANTIPSVVTKQQGAAWDIGAYVH